LGSIRITKSNGFSVQGSGRRPEDMKREEAKGGQEMKTEAEKGGQNGKSTNGNGVVRTVAYVVIGGVVGAGAAFLLAPKAGTEMRHKIKETAGGVIHKAGEFADQAVESAQSVVHKGKRLIDNNKSVIQFAVEAGKMAYRREKERIAAR
jgi:gas vesicle protein